MKFCLKLHKIFHLKIAKRMNEICAFYFQNVKRDYCGRFLLGAKTDVEKLC